MSHEIRFGELPIGRQGPNSPADTVAKALRARPGEWALIKTADSVSRATSTAWGISHGRVRAYEPSGAFEATTRGNDVWARYVGGAS